MWTSTYQWRHNQGCPVENSALYADVMLKERHFVALNAYKLIVIVLYPLVFMNIESHAEHC